MEIKSKSSHFKKRLILILSIVVVACTIIVCVFIATGSDQRRLDSLLDTGNKYLSELDYEQAIVAYEAAIAIDSKCEEAYIGLADAYVAMGEFEKALEILNEGYELTASENIMAKIEAVNALLAQDSGQAGTGLEDHVMEWGDEGLEQGMREVTGITDRDIMLSDVWNLRELWLNGGSIKNIAALRELTNLEELDLYGNQISDITPLSGLTNLEELDLSYNQISDITPLSGLTNLYFLDLYGNTISDISPVSSLPNLANLKY